MTITTKRRLMERKIVELLMQGASVSTIVRSLKVGKKRIKSCVKKAKPGAICRRKGAGPAPRPCRPIRKRSFQTRRTSAPAGWGQTLVGKWVEEVLSRHDAAADLRWLAELLKRELDARRERAINRRIENAEFPEIKTLEGFDWGFNRKLANAAIDRMFEAAKIVAPFGDQATG